MSSDVISEPASLRFRKVNWNFACVAKWWRH